MKKLYIALILLLFWTHQTFAQVLGCTDILANNFNASANKNDGSCLYNAASIVPVSSYSLNSSLLESSGLITWQDRIWTHNDNSDNHLYALDTNNGGILQTYTLKNTVNNDWEEISQDKDYVYMGDFGNNANGNRTNLKILRVEKQSLLNNTPAIDTISFAYSNQSDFTATGSNKTDFDCEAFIVTSDSIYLINKQWISNKTSLYVLPKTPGTHIAQLKATLDVQGLITGATYLESQRLIALCGYSSLLQPFVYLLYDFNGTDFFSGNKRKISISLPLHQVEGIATVKGLKYYISNENLSKPPLVNNPQKLHILDLSNFLNNYLYGIPLGLSETVSTQEGFSVYPNPSSDLVTIETTFLGTNFELINTLGKTVLKGTLSQNNSSINIGDVPAGVYTLKLNTARSFLYKIIKQ